MQKYYYKKSNVLDAIIIGSNTIFYCLSAIDYMIEKTKISFRNYSIATHLLLSR